MKKRLVVSGGVIIRDDGKILLAQRKTGGFMELLWEFPGGKLEENETIEECLIREIDEELGIDIVIGDLIETVDFEYEVGIVTLYVFFASCKNHHHTKMNSHDKIVWIDIDEVENFTLVPADKLIIPSLKKLHQSSFQSPF